MKEEGERGSERGRRKRKRKEKEEEEGERIKKWQEEKMQLKSCS